MIVLDRFEGNIAVIDDNGVMKNISREMVDKTVKEGSVLSFKNGKYFLDEDKTKARREKLIGLQDSLFE